MYYNLIPIVEKKALKHEYRMRLVIVGCFLMSTAFVFGIGELFPSFIHSYTEERSRLSAVNSIKKDNDNNGITNIDKALTTDAATVDILASGLKDTKLSTLLQSIISLRGQTHISTFGITRSAPQEVSIDIQGVAPTREALLSFKSRLESYNSGKKIDFPPSQLVKSSNINFSIHFTQKLP